MSTQTDSTSQPPFGAQTAAPTVPTRVRPLYWALRRELWEHRAVTLAPAAVGAVVMFGFLISLFNLPSRVRTALTEAADKRFDALSHPFDIAASVFMMTSILVGVFYCLDALHGERRDRSILFWKSLPVSDLSTVLSKFGVPMLVLPPIAVAMTLPVQLAMLLLSSAVLAGNGISPAPLWALPWFQKELILLYGIVAVTLWHAPIYAWLLLVSAWARRAVFLWALLPPLALCAVEKLAFDTTYFTELIGGRVVGVFDQAFRFNEPGSDEMQPLTMIAPGRYLASAGLWLGLAVAAGFLAAAVRLRRLREPI